MNTPFFSIIIPVYNTPKEYLLKCLKSIVTQDYTSYEVICINDGSTDDSLEILNDYANKYNCIKVINQPNSGVSIARNTGIDAAKGDYILFVDSDDYYLRNTVLSELADTLKTDDYDCIYFPGANVGTNPDGSTWYVENHYEEKIYNNAWECLEDNCLKPKLLVFGSPVAQCYKTQIVKENNLRFNENLSYGEDRLFVLLFFACAGKTYVYSQPCYCYFTRRGSLMTRKDKEEKKIRDAFLAPELMYNTIQLSTPHYNRYVNGLYLSAILKKPTKQFKIKILLATAIRSRSVKKVVKSFLLVISPKLYLKIFK